MPFTCVKLMDALVDRRSQDNGVTTPVHVTGEFGIGTLCANHLAIVTCLAENIYEMQHTENPLVWGSGFLYNSRQAFLLTTQLCTVYAKREYDFRCLKQAAKRLHRCDSRIRDGLHYIRNTMRWDLSVAKKRETICSVFHPLIPCIKNELSGRCSVGITDIIVKILQIFGGSKRSEERSCRERV